MQQFQLWVDSEICAAAVVVSMALTIGSASSSSCVGPIAFVPTEPIAGELKEETALAVPVKGNVFVDHIGSQTVVTHALTLESKTLDRLFNLELSDDGTVGMVVSCDDDEDQLDLDDDVFTKRVVLKHSTQEYLVIQKVGSKCKTSNWADMFSSHKAGQLHLLVGASSATAELDTYIFAKPRSFGQRAFVSLHSVYKFMQLTAYKGQSCDWVDRCYNKWLDALQQHCGPGTYFVHSTFMHGKLPKKATLPWIERCLPSTSISTFGLLIMCSRWAWKSPQGGGFIDNKHRQCSELLLASLLSVFKRQSMQGHVLAIELEKDWVCRFPRPAAVVDHVGVLGLVCTAAGLDLSPLQARAEGTFFCCMFTYCK